MSWLADLKCGDPRCGCTGNPIRSNWNPSGPYVGMGLDMGGPGQTITGGTYPPGYLVHYDGKLYRRT